MKHELKITIKESQKELARKIRNGKTLRKPANRGEETSLDDWYKLERNQYEYRHRHIAYCELRGRTREQIENKTNNPPNNNYIDKLKEEWSHEEQAA